VADSRGWIRSAAWDRPAQERFFARLKRCSAANQPQLAVSKAWALRKTGDPPLIRQAIELYRWIQKTYRDKETHARVLREMAECHLDLGDLDVAISLLRKVLRLERKNPTPTSEAWSRFAHLVVSRKLGHLYGEVLAVLDRSADEDDVLWPADKFLIHAARALISYERRRWDAVSADAKEALECSRAVRSGITRHPKLGLVDAGDPLIDRVRRALQDPKVRAAGVAGASGPRKAPMPPRDPVAALEWKFLVQLSELNVKAKSLWELPARPDSYTRALPTLARALESVPADEKYEMLRRHLIDALMVRTVVKHAQGAEILMRVYRAADELTRWNVAPMLEMVLRPEHADFVLKGIHDRDDAGGREALLPLLKKLLPDQAERLLIDLLNDETLGRVWVLVELGSCGTRRAVPRITPFLSHSERHLREKARWALRRIHARGR
jgi:tetratricopeptide (TPR) repeat protein